MTLVQNEDDVEVFRCSNCDLWKPRREFGNDKSRPDGVPSWCRDCRNDSTKSWRLENAERKKKIDICWRYGLTENEYQALSKVCEICGTSKNLCVDHDHVFGFLRGRLCQHCNRGLGGFQDDVGLLEKAIEYLRKY